MPDNPPPKEPSGAGPAGPEPIDEAAEARRADRGLSDFVKRAFAAGFEGASRAKEDVVRVATTEIRNWLDGLELDRELRKALANMIVEVKAEIRFRPVAGGDDAAPVGDDVKLAVDTTQSEVGVRRERDPREK